MTQRHDRHECISHSSSTWMFVRTTFVVKISVGIFEDFFQFILGIITRDIIWTLPGTKGQYPLKIDISRRCFISILELLRSIVHQLCPTSDVTNKLCPVEDVTDDMWD